MDDELFDWATADLEAARCKVEELEAELAAERETTRRLRRIVEAPCHVAIGDRTMFAVVDGQEICYDVFRRFGSTRWDAERWVNGKQRQTASFHRPEDAVEWIEQQEARDKAIDAAPRTT